jgi:hypothetical protein
MRHPVTHLRPEVLDLRGVSLGEGVHLRFQSVEVTLITALVSRQGLEVGGSALGQLDQGLTLSPPTITVSTGLRLHY